MAFGAGVITLVFDRKILPLLDIAEAMEVVSEAIAVHTEVIRNQKAPGDQDQSDQSDREPQRVQYVSLHQTLVLSLP